MEEILTFPIVLVDYQPCISPLIKKEHSITGLDSILNLTGTLKEVNHIHQHIKKRLIFSANLKITLAEGLEEKCG